MTFGTAFASICGEIEYPIETSPSFWRNKQSGGCDFIDQKGCLVHVEIFTRYRFFINFGTFERIQKIGCPEE